MPPEIIIFLSSYTNVEFLEILKSKNWKTFFLHCTLIQFHTYAFFIDERIFRHYFLKKILAF